MSLTAGTRWYGQSWLTALLSANCTLGIRTWARGSVLFHLFLTARPQFIHLHSAFASFGFFHLGLTSDGNRAKRGEPSWGEQYETEKWIDRQSIGEVTKRTVDHIWLARIGSALALPFPVLPSFTLLFLPVFPSLTFCSLFHTVIKRVNHWNHMGRNCKELNHVNQWERAEHWVKAREQMVRANQPQRPDGTK